MTFRRGFKTEAERISLEVRLELALSATDRLEVLVMAAHLGIPVIPMSALPEGDGQGGFLHVFRYREQESFSAVTIFKGDARLIVHNDSHHPHRQASNIAHEVSHCLLEHKPSPLVSDSGCRHWNAEFEAEADWLGGALLVPRDGALSFVRAGLSADEIAEHYGVSEALCRWRLNQTGVMQQMQRYARRWG